MDLMFVFMWDAKNYKTFVCLWFFFFESIFFSFSFSFLYRMELYILYTIYIWVSIRLAIHKVCVWLFRFISSIWLIVEEVFGITITIIIINTIHHSKWSETFFGTCCFFLLSSFSNPMLLLLSLPHFYSHIYFFLYMLSFPYNVIR